MKRTSYCCCTKLYEIAVRRCTKCCTKSVFKTLREGVLAASSFENKGFQTCAGVRSGLYFLPHGESTSFTSMGSLVRVQLSPPLGSPCRSRASTFFALRHHRRRVYFFQGSPWRREQLGPPFRSHGRLAQLPENRGGFVVESGKKASPKRCSGDALNLNYFRFSCSSRDRQTGRCHSAVTIIYA